MYLLVWSLPPAVSGAEWIIVALGVVLDIVTRPTQHVAAQTRYADGQAAVSTAPRRDRPSGKGRAIAARDAHGPRGVLALVGSIAFYLERTVLSEDGFETIATELIQSEEIRDQVAATAVEQLYANVDVEQEIADRLPEAQKALAPVLAGYHRRAGRPGGCERLLERPRLQEALVRTATSTQRQVVELLDDEGEFVSTTGTIYARPAADRRRPRRAVGIVSRLAEQLPRDAGQIKLVDSDQLDTAQTITRILRVPRELALARRTAARRPGGLARERAPAHRAPGDRDRAHRRRRAELLVRRVAGAYLVDELTTDATEPAGSGRMEHPHPGLADRAWIAIVLGLLLLVGVWLVGPTAWRVARAGSSRRSRRSPLWTYGAVAGLVVVLAALVPLFQRGLHLVPRLPRAARVGVEVLRRIVLRSETGTADSDTPGRQLAGAARNGSAMLLDEIARTSAGGRRRRRARPRSPRSRPASRGCARTRRPIAVAYLSGVLPHGPIGVGWAGAARPPAAGRAARLELARGRCGAPAIGGERPRLAGARAAASSAELFSPARRPPSSASSARSSTASSARARSRAWSSTRSRAPPDVPVADVRRALMLAGDLGAVRPRRSRRRAGGLARFGLEVLRPLKPMLAQTAETPARRSSGSGRGRRVEARRRPAPGAPPRRRGPRVHAQPRRRHRPRARGRRGGARAAGRGGRPRRRGDRAARRRSPHPFQVTMSRFGSRDASMRVPRCRCRRSSSTASTSTARTSSTGRSQSDARRSSRASRRDAPGSGRDDDAEEAERFLEDALAHGHEGVMVKALDAPYEAGGAARAGSR